MVKINDPTKEHRCNGKPIPLPEHHRGGCVHLNQQGINCSLTNINQEYHKHWFVDLSGIKLSNFSSTHWARKPLNTSRKWRASCWGTSPKPWWGEFPLTISGAKKFPENQYTMRPLSFPTHNPIHIWFVVFYTWWFQYIDHPIQWIKPQRSTTKKVKLKRN